MGARPDPKLATRCRFGPFDYDGASGELCKHGARIRLQGKPLQVLSALLERPGHPVSREDLQQRLWAGTTFVDFEHGLNAAVNKLRQALRDSAEQPRYIETLPTRGYRFIAPVTRDAPEPVVKMPLPPVERDPHPLLKSPGWPWPVAIVLLILLCLGALSLFRARTEEAEPAASTSFRFTVSPPPGFVLEAASSRQSFALSPDGNRIAFTAMNHTSVYSLFLRDFSELESQLIPNSTGAHSVFWHPQGQSLYYSMRGKLRRTELQGDAYQLICDAPPILLTGILLRPDRLLLSGRFGSYVVPAFGGTPEAIHQKYDWPQLLPDGEHLLYVAYDSQTGRRRVRTARYGDADSAKDLVETDSRAVYVPSAVKRGVGHLLYVRAGNLLAAPFDPVAREVKGDPSPVAANIYTFASGAADFSVSRGMLAYQSFVSRSQITWVDRQGRKLETIGPGDLNFKYARLSPDGRKVAAAVYDVHRGASDIWIFDTTTGAGRRVTAGFGHTDSPVWSPDSSRLIFSRVLESGPKLFLRGIGEKEAEQAIPARHFQMATGWSPDGRFIAFNDTGFTHIESEQQGDVWLVDLTRGAVIPLLNTPFHEANAVFSPDGSWIAFTSNESGRTEAYVQEFRYGDSPDVVGERHVVSRQGAICLRWRADGKELLFLGGDGWIHAVPIRTTPRLVTGTPVPLFPISIEARAAIHSVPGFDVSADGQRLLIPTVTSAESSKLVVVQNWEATLPRR